MTTSHVIIQSLKTAGFRLTKAREEIINFIAKTRHPFTADELQSALRAKRIPADRTTVYRELSFLESRGILQTVNFGDGTKRFENKNTRHHHHLVCVSCRRVLDVETPHTLGNIETSLAAQNGWSNITHALEFFGTCPTCLR